MRIKLTNMLSIFADSLDQASNFQSIVINGCSPAANLIFPACLGKCLETKGSSKYDLTSSAAPTSAMRCCKPLVKLAKQASCNDAVRPKTSVQIGKVIADHILDSPGDWAFFKAQTPAATDRVRLH